MGKIRMRYIISATVLSGLFLLAWNFNSSFNPFAALNFQNQLLFTNLDQFILVGEKIELADNVQISSGDLAANEEIRIKNNNIINSNLFADEVRIGATSTINGNASFNQLETAPTVRILGQTSTPISLLIIKLPAISDFPTGNQKLFINQTSTISPGNFDEIEVQENIQLAFNPGTYNFNKLKLNKNSKLLFSGPTTINIKKELVIKEKVLIAQTINISSTDLQINVQEDEDIEFGADSLLSFKLLAPDSQINLGQRITFRGQILAEEIKVGKDSMLSREDEFIKGSDPNTLVTALDKSVFPVNEIIVNFTSSATFSDAQDIANFVNGRIVGFTEIANSYQIEVVVATIAELQVKIQAIRNLQNPLVEGVFRNYILEIF